MARDFGDFVVGVVGVFGEIIGQDFGFDQILEASWQCARKRESDMII